MSKMSKTEYLGTLIVTGASQESARPWQSLPANTAMRLW